MIYELNIAVLATQNCLYKGLDLECGEGRTAKVWALTFCQRGGQTKREISYRDRTTRYNTFLKDLFEKVIVLSFTAYGLKICILCRH
jgi:hypothetical protein